MNNNIVVRNEGQWPIAPYQDGRNLGAGQRSYSAAAILDFPTLIRIIHHWRWLVVGAVGIGLAAAILFSLLTRPVYRASVILEANPPAVAISDEQTRQQDSQAMNSYDFVATQVGLLGSRAVAERTAQELNLANNPDIVAQDTDASQRLRTAASVVEDGLHVTAPEQGQLIKFSFDSTSPQLAALVANGVADSFINTSLQRRYEASAYARNFLERQINKTRGDLERSERAVVAYAQQQGIINTGGNVSPDGKQSGDTNSLQGESLVQLNTALAAATARRVAAEGAYRQGMATGPTTEVNNSVLPLRQELARLQADYQQKREFMPFGSGLGSFVNVYRLYESPDKVTNEYVVHAHNDYAELALELGVPGIVLMVLFLATWLVAAKGAWRRDAWNPFAQAASIASAAVLVHSLVDFPLRTAAVSATFAMCMALMAERRVPARVDTNDLRPTRHLVIA